MLALNYANMRPMRDWLVAKGLPETFISIDSAKSQSSELIVSGTSRLLKYHITVSAQQYSILCQHGVSRSRVGLADSVEMCRDMILKDFLNRKMG